MPWEPLPARHPTATTTSRPTIWNRIRKFTRRSVQIGVGDDPVATTTSRRSVDSRRVDVLARRVISPAPRRSSRRAQSMSMNLAPRRTDTLVQRISMNLAPRRSDSPHNSVALPNYTQRACALADKEFEDDEVTSAQEIFEELLDTPSGRDFVNLQAAVLRARKRGTSRIEMQRESVDVPWGFIFFKPSQLEALGWKSDLVNGSQSHLDVVSLF